MSIVCGLCLISLLTGVYSTLTTETEVHIKVFAPYNFVRNKSEVYFNIGKQAEVRTDKSAYQLEILQYGKKNFPEQTEKKNAMTMMRCELNMSALKFASFSLIQLPFLYFSGGRCLCVGPA